LTSFSAEIAWKKYAIRKAAYWFAVQGSDTTMLLYNKMLVTKLLFILQKIRRLVTANQK